MTRRAVRLVAAAAILVLSLTCAAWFYKHRISPATPSVAQALQPPTTPKLSDAYATASNQDAMRVKASYLLTEPEPTLNPTVYPCAKNFASSGVLNRGSNVDPSMLI